MAREATGEAGRFFIIKKRRKKGGVKLGFEQLLACEDPEWIM